MAKKLISPVSKSVPTTRRVSRAGTRQYSNAPKDQPSVKQNVGAPNSKGR
jgi:hypothetical protein